MPADTKPDEEEWGEGFDEAEIQCIREARAFKSELAVSVCVLRCDGVRNCCCCCRRLRRRSVQ